MSFFINRQPRWIVKALNVAPTGDSAPPNFIPDTIAPTLDVFGWERFGDIKYDTSVGVNGSVEVKPKSTADWLFIDVANPGTVPPGVAARLVVYVHVDHNDLTSRVLWAVVQDRLTLTEVKLPTDGGFTPAPRFIPIAITRPFLLRPREFMIGRCQTIGAGNALTMRYGWIDLEEGEYIPGFRW